MNFSFAAIKQKLMDYYTGEPLSSPRASTSKQPPSSRDKEQYDSLLLESDSEAAERRIPLSRRRGSRCRASRSQHAATGRCAVLATDSSTRRRLFIPGKEKETRPTGDELGGCGDSVEEARSKGCVFDPMSWAWQRPECYHPELVADFLKRTDWHFYTTKEMRAADEVPYEAWVRGDYPQRYNRHQFHCTYSWRKFHEAFRAKAPMDNDILQMAHTMHCDSVFLHDYDPALATRPCDALPGGCQLTELHAGFNRCGWW
ncbi:hypothetical protein ONZ43_g2022 [Nemania bipapillata]|uniref:Uncharacterized protein n=1 Tax=Nemania bipapillata TaxID=110536 RepID=A0ACC2J248_9PEZI|nr:hypothetical protein ONZ43_g2022 [Nemania bipapillata]